MKQGKQAGPRSQSGGGCVSRAQRFNPAVLALAIMSFGVSAACSARGDTVTAAVAAAPALDVQRLLDDAVAAHRSEVTLAPGVYRVKPSTNTSAYHLNLKNVADLAIRGDGTTLVFENPQNGGILFERCQRVTLSGLTLDWDPLPFTQGRITSLHTAEAAYDIQVDPGYAADPALFAKGAEVFLYDPQSRHLKHGAWEVFGVGVTRAEPGVLRVHFKSAQSLHDSTAAVGDLAVAGARLKMGIRFMECAGVTVTGVTIRTAPGIAIQEANGEGGGHYSYTVAPGPAPAGGPARLLSATADAFHSANVRRGPVVENCRFESQGDDGIAIHGTYSLVTEATKAAAITISPKREMVYRVGDHLRVYDRRTYQFKGEARITAIDKAQVPTGASAEPIRAVWQQYRDDLPGKRYFTLTLEHALQADLGDLASSPEWDGCGFTVRNNVLGHSRGRGILVKASDGLIEGNRLEDITGGGICLGPEFASWLESDYVQNVTVRNNSLQNIGIGANCMKNTRSIYVGAITVYAASPAKSLPPGQGNRQIVIEGNRIDASGGIGMLIACAQDLQVRSNRIGTTHILGSMVGGAMFGVDPEAAVFVTESARVRFEGNRTSGKGIVLGTNVVDVAN